MHPPLDSRGFLALFRKASERTQYPLHSNWVGLSPVAPVTRVVY
jgi:hypothetical protein